MAKFIITRTYKHTESLEVEAPDQDTAWEMAALLEDEFVLNFDDWLYDEEIKEVKG